MDKWVYLNDCEPPFLVNFYKTESSFSWLGFDKKGIPREISCKHIYGSKEDATGAMVKDIKLEINKLLNRLIKAERVKLIE